MSKMRLHLLELCAKCNALVSEGKFYTALKIVELIERDYLKNIPVKKLRVVVERRIPAIKLHIEEKVCNEVNEWLFHIRTFAKEIGQKAIAHTASVRQNDEQVKAHQMELEVNNRSQLPEAAYSSDIEEVDEDLSLKIDLTPIYRAYHLHEILKCWRKVTGYFIVEDRVLRLRQCGRETAVAKITSLVGAQFSMMSNTMHFLCLKQYLFLFGTTLRHHGYEVSSLLECINGTKDKYSKLL